MRMQNTPFPATHSLPLHSLVLRLLLLLQLHQEQLVGGEEVGEDFGAGHVPVDDRRGLQSAARLVDENDRGQAVGGRRSDLHDGHRAQLARQPREEARAAKRLGQVPRPQDVVVAVQVVRHRLRAEHLTAEDVRQHRLIVVQIQGERTPLQKDINRGTGTDGRHD